MHPPQSWLVLDAKHHPLAFMLKLTTPSIRVNGYPVRARWGENPVSLPPGRHLLQVHVDYMIQMGPAQQEVWLRPGETVRLEYRAPLWMWLRGALGQGPQPWPGAAAMIALYVVLGAFLLLIFLGIVAAMAFS